MVGAAPSGRPPSSALRSPSTVHHLPSDHVLGAAPPAPRVALHSASPTDRSRIDTHLLSAASLRAGHQKPSRVLRWLRSHHAVRSVTLATDGRTFDIRFRDGMRAAILPAALGTVRSSKGELTPRARQSSPPRQSTPQALVLEPFATELQMGPTAGDAEVNDLQSAGYHVDYLYDTQVTVNTFTTLSQYNVVYMHTHSGPGAGGIVATGEPANGDPSVAPYLADGSVIVSSVAGTAQQYYGITSRFVLYHLGQFPANSLLFVNGCALLGSGSFPQALASRGLGVLVSWDQDSKAPENFLAAAVFFGQMSQGATVDSAIAATRASPWGTSTVTYNGVTTTATIGYQGNGQITLQSAKQPIPGGGPPSSTATPQPTATPTAIPPPSTSTSTPTSTSVPTSTPTATTQPASPPPLAIQLKSRVSPGSQQVITARSGPKVAVRFLVAFPNGDQRSSTSTTNAAGIARYSYLQAPSEIRHGHVFATVTVAASNGSATTTRSQTYRIRWSAIDVSVEPRNQSVGHTVTVWVHSRAHRIVTVSIMVPQKGQVARFSGRTGAGGWVHHAYTVKRAWQTAAQRTVQVRATVHLGNSIYRTQTTLRIT